MVIDAIVASVAEGVDVDHFESGFLRGPRLRRRELRTILRVSQELLHGFRRLHFVGPCVTIFGSARIAEHEQAYIAARSLA